MLFIIYVTCYILVCYILHNSERCLSKAENGMSVHRAEIEMIPWTSGVKLKDELSCLKL